MTAPNCTGQKEGFKVCSSRLSGATHHGSRLVYRSVSPSFGRHLLVLLLFGFWAKCLAVPQIDTQPQDQSVNPGATATFWVAAHSGYALDYQWTSNNVDIPLATHTNYTTRPAQPIDDGMMFLVRVHDQNGTQPSTQVKLSVRNPPTITRQPTDQTVTAGATATFSVTASGTAPLAYQWRFAPGVPIAGATKSTYSIINVQATNSGSSYWVTVTNAAGTNVSRHATFTVLAITAPPQGVITNAGSDVTFSVGASGSQPLSYQWLFNGSNVSAATDSDFPLTKVQPRDAGAYSVVAANAAGSVTSSPATLTVVALPILTSPQRLTNGQFRFTLGGSAGQSYVILASSNLADWVPFGTNTLTNGSALISDTQAHSLGRRYYRARWP